MTAPRAGTPGATRECPHCRETILESAVVCPGCRHHVKFGQSAHDGAVEVVTTLRVEGNIRNPVEGGAREYCMVLTIRNEQGQEVARRVVGVGAMQPDEQRSFSLAVEMTPVSDKSKRPARH
jgi:hypothetical protein